MSTERRPMIPLGAGDQASSLTREEIRYRNQVEKSSDSWVSPHHGDGGWHTTPGMQLYTTEWQPLRDRILVQLFDEPIQYAGIYRPDKATALHAGTRRGIILKVGPGRWIDGYFYKLVVKPGDEIVIGRWSDWESADAGWGPNVVICQEDDIRVKFDKPTLFDKVIEVAMDEAARPGAERVVLNIRGYNGQTDGNGAKEN